MKVLLDTHALIWWLNDGPALSRSARDLIGETDHQVFVSAASAMEIVTKYRLGKLPEAAVLAQNFEALVRDEGFDVLPITVRHAVIAGGLRIAHKDPFDRILIAQSMSEGLPLVSNEQGFDMFGVARIW